MFREVSQRRALFRDPSDAGGWVEAVRALTQRDSSLARSAAQAASAYVAMTGEEYFAAIETFLATL